MFDPGRARDAFAAVKKAAGPRMQVRKIEISREKMSVLAVDPDMSQSRYVPGSGRAGHPGHWYQAPEVYEQSWRVSYWTAFGYDWYRVSGPTPEGVIQENEGPSFNLRPQDLMDPAEVMRRATPDPALSKSPCALTLIVAKLWWSVCVDTQGEPLLVFLQSK
jgi:hypothetical protein